MFNFNDDGLRWNWKVAAFKDGIKRNPAQIVSSFGAFYAKKSDRPATWSDVQKTTARPDVGGWLPDGRREI